MASVYWVRSLVPIERKRAWRASTSASHTALGVSIITPISRSWSWAMPARASSAATSAHMRHAPSTSSSLDTIGNIMRTRPCALAR